VFPEIPVAAQLKRGEKTILQNSLDVGKKRGQSARRGLDHPGGQRSAGVVGVTRISIVLSRRVVKYGEKIAVDAQNGC